MNSRILSLRSGARLAASTQIVVNNNNNRSKIILRCKSSRPDPKSLFDTANKTANEFFVALRWKAANALTASMPEDEREKLLEKFQPKLAETDSEVVAASTIAEAVAAAQAKEAQRQEGKWEILKGKIYEEAEQAAKARVESDLSIQKSRLEKMKIDFEQEKKRADASTVVDAVEVGAQDEEVHHPVLGPIVLDLGYKRLHRVSAQALSAIPVYEKQRTYRHDRAKKMAEDKMKSLHLGMPGIIGLHEDPKGKLSIIDGQHRVGMMTILMEKEGLQELDLTSIIVEVYPQMPHHDADHAQEIFVEVNKAEPVKLVDMPGVAKMADRKVINAVAEKLAEKYPAMFSPSQRCRLPNLNVDNFRDALFGADVLKRHSIKTNKALEAWIMEQNEALAAKFENEGASHNVSDAALKKSRKHRFYLGLDQSWLYQ